MALKQRVGGIESFHFALGNFLEFWAHPRDLIGVVKLDGACVSFFYFLPRGLAIETEEAQRLPNVFRLRCLSRPTAWSAGTAWLANTWLQQVSDNKPDDIRKRGQRQELD